MGGSKMAYLQPAEPALLWMEEDIELLCHAYCYLEPPSCSHLEQTRLPAVSDWEAQKQSDLCLCGLHLFIHSSWKMDFSVLLDIGKCSHVGLKMRWPSPSASIGAMCHNYGPHLRRGNNTEIISVLVIPYMRFPRPDNHNMKTAGMGGVYLAPYACLLFNEIIIIADPLRGW